MASLSRVTKARRRLKAKKQGRTRKSQLSRKSTPSYDDLFGALGKPGEQAPPQM